MRKIVESKGKVGWEKEKNKSDKYTNENWQCDNCSGYSDRNTWFLCYQSN